MAAHGQNKNGESLGNGHGELALFSDPQVLRRIGHVRLGKLLDVLAEDFGQAEIELPPQPDPAYSRLDEPEGSQYFKALAAVFKEQTRLPSHVRQVLRGLEKASAPENFEWLDQTIQKRVPTVSLEGLCDLDRVLEVWFAAPEELKQFEVSANAGQKAPTKGKEETDEEAFARLALLTPVQYDRVRKQEAARMGIRVETLNTEVGKIRSKNNNEVKGAEVHLREIEPWPEPVDIAVVLNDVSGRYARQLVLPGGGADAMALWTSHTHVFKAFLQTPRLNLYSAVSGCGKTTALDIIATMVPRPIRTENLTAQSLFRIVAQFQPTLLLDEVDAYLNQAEELRGMLNAGHKRGSCAYRCEGEGNSVRGYEVFAPAVLSGIGLLPGTLHDRSIAICLVKALPGEVGSHFDEQEAKIEEELARKLARWALDNFATLQACRPKMPEGAYNRLADNWRPLFAIAELAGGDWPERVLAAFKSLTAKAELEGQGTSVRLLHDIRQVFQQAGTEQLTSKQLVHALCELADSPWPEAHRGGKAITENWLARQLRAFGIGSHNIRVGEQRAKGYNVADFSETFRRYLKEE